MILPVELAHSYRLAVNIGEIWCDHLRDHRQSLLQNWEVRSLLEIRAAELAARKSSDDQMDATIRGDAVHYKLLQGK